MQVSGVVLGRLLQCGEGFAPGQDALAFDEPGGLIYLGTGNWERRTATAGSKAAWDALADLRNRYRHACLRAFLARDAPDVRFALSLGLTLDPAAYPAELAADLDHARRLVLAYLDRYEQLLRAQAEQPSTTITRPRVQQ